MNGLSVWGWLAVLVLLGIGAMLLARSDEVGPSLKRTILESFKFTGRSTRRDVVYFWFVWMMLGVVAEGAVEQSFDSFREEFVAKAIVSVLVMLPMFALFARRLHDQNRSALWTLLLPIPIVVNIDKALGYAFVDARGEIPSQLLPNEAVWVAAPIVMAFFIALIIPGTIGPNRYGPDPREGGP